MISYSLTLLAYLETRLLELKDRGGIQEPNALKAFLIEPWIHPPLSEPGGQTEVSRLRYRSPKHVLGIFKLSMWVGMAFDIFENVVRSIGLL